jgi:hypothetical protein
MTFVSINSLEPDRDRALQVVHGLSNPGTDDRDEMGVCIEPPEYILELRRVEHCVARTQPEGSPSGPGDVDLTIYGLRKLASLARKGSPTVLLLFFIRGDDVLEQSELGVELQALAPAFLSARTGRAFLVRTGAISLPVTEPTRSRLREVRAGTVPLDEVLAEIARLEKELEALTGASRLPAEPDHQRINAFLESAYQRWRSEHQV